MPVEELASVIQRVLDTGAVRTFERRTMYWDAQDAIIVIVNPHDLDGGTAFPSYREYFERWGEP